MNNTITKAAMFALGVFGLSNAAMADWAGDCAGANRVIDPASETCRVPLPTSLNQYKPPPPCLDTKPESFSGGASTTGCPLGASAGGSSSPFQGMTEQTQPQTQTETTPLGTDPSSIEEAAKKALESAGGTWQ